jgi:hypothetical protein
MMFNSSKGSHFIIVFILSYRLYLYVNRHDTLDNKIYKFFINIKISTIIKLLLFTSLQYYSHLKNYDKIEKILNCIYKISVYFMAENLWS